MSKAVDQAIERARGQGAGGDLVSAEATIRAAIATNRKAAPLHFELSQILGAQGRGGDVEAALRAAVDCDPLFAPAAYSLCQGLLSMGRLEEGLAVILPMTKVARPEGAALALKGHALKGMGRLEEATEAFRDAIAADPNDPSHHHNLAVALEEADRNAEATNAVRAARALGLDRPETWLVEGRTLVRQDRFEEAESAFRELLRRTPDYPPAFRELGQLIWMRTGDIEAATRDVRAAIAAHPGQPLLRVVEAKILEYAGDPKAAYEALSSITGEGAPAEAELSASQAAISFDPQAALVHAERAERYSPGHPLALSVLAEANLAAGKPAEALKAARRLKAELPLNQHALALEATAQRLAGDDSYKATHDYDSLVHAQLIDTPEGWDSLPDFLHDLATALDTLHKLRAHPIGQSLRGGTQTQQNLLTYRNPALEAFFKAVDGPIRRTLAALGQGDDPVRSRNTGEYRISGAWSVNLQPGGHHVDHLHPAGWLSSACYIDLPPAIDGEGKEGWLRFGHPGIPTDPPLEAEHWVKPQPGLLVLFPSYMWHGTEPFGGEHRRLTIAFDLIPA